MLFMPETRSRSLEQIEDAFNGSVVKQIKRSSGIYTDAIELQRQLNSTASIREVSPNPSRDGSIERSDAKVMGPARAIKAMASVESIRRWLLS